MAARLTRMHQQERRYQVFLCTSGIDMQPERIALQQALAGLGFFCWGPEIRTPQSTTFARRQIDDCDYFILLLGGRYGDLTASGVSYLHLEYIYAVTKQKPILVLLHADPERRDNVLPEQTDEGRAKLDDFRRRLLLDQPLTVQYQDIRELDMVVRQALPRLVERFPMPGWTRGVSESESAVGYQHAVTTALAPATAEPSQAAVSGQEGIGFEYRVHAYQDGNFRELRLHRSLTWHELLQVLGPAFMEGQPEDQFARVLNDYLNNTALAQAREQMPRAHAVARSQVQAKALQQIRQQLKDNGWLVPTGRDERYRTQWQVTSLGRQVLAQLRQQQTTV